MTLLSENPILDHQNLYNKAEAHFEIGDQLRALEFYSQSLDLIDLFSLELQQPFLAFTLNKMGDAYRDIGDNEKAIELYKQSLTVFKFRLLQNGEDSNVSIITTIIEGKQSHLKGDFIQAKKYYQLALNLIQIHYASDIEKKARILNKLGDVSRDLNNFELAKNYHESALTILKTQPTRNKILIATTLRKLGNVFQRLKNHAAALECYQMAINLKLKEYPDNSMAIANILNSLGSLYYDMQQFKESQNLLLRAREIIIAHYHAFENRYLSSNIKYLTLAEQQIEKIITRKTSLPHILFIAGNAGKNEKKLYLKALFKHITKSVYVNIDNLIEIFEKPATSPFTTAPSHKVIRELAEDNLNQDKNVLIDGNYDESIMSELFKAQDNIKIIYFNSSDTKQNILLHLEMRITAAENILTIDTRKNFADNIDTILNLIPRNFLNPAKKPHQPVLALSAGLAGVGKTTTFSAVNATIADSIFLQKDTIGLPYLESVGLTMQSDCYGTYVKNQTYAALFKLAEDNLQFNNHALIDGWFGDKLQEAWLKPHLGARDYTTTIIYCHCPADLEHARIIARGAERDNAKMRDFAGNRQKDLQAHLKHFAQVTQESIVLINTAPDNLAANVAKIIEILNLPRFRSLQAKNREIPCVLEDSQISSKEAAGSLKVFQACLHRTNKNYSLKLFQHTFRKTEPTLMDEPLKLGSGLKF